MRRKTKYGSRTARVTLHVLPGDRGPSSSSPTPLSLTTRDRTASLPSPLALPSVAALPLTRPPSHALSRPPSRRQNPRSAYWPASRARRPPQMLLASVSRLHRKEALTPRHPAAARLLDGGAPQMGQVRFARSHVPCTGWNSCPCRPSSVPAVNSQQQMQQRLGWPSALASAARTGSDASSRAMRPWRRPRARGAPLLIAASAPPPPTPPPPPHRRQRRRQRRRLAGRRQLGHLLEHLVHRGLHRVTVGRNRRRTARRGWHARARAAPGARRRGRHQRAGEVPRQVRACAAGRAQVVPVA